MSTLLENLPARLRLAMELLAEQPAGDMNAQQLWDAVAVQVPLTEYEQTQTKSGEVRGRNAFLWYSVDLVKAGWLAKSGHGVWRITQKGREALEQYPDPPSFREAASAAYKQWESLQQVAAADDDDPEALSTRLVPPKDDVMVRSVARTMLETGLRDAGSHFVPGRSVWSPETVDDLHARYNEHPDLSASSFMTKLQGQLAGAPDDTILLVAELLTLYSLPLSNQGAGTKRGRIRTVLGWLQDAVTLPGDVDAAFNQGSWHGGMGMNMGQWRALAQLVELVRYWWQLPEQTRSDALDDPWVWEQVVHAAPEEMPTQREALLYLGFPEAFLPSVSRDHKERIRGAFAGAVDELSGDLDRDLCAITLALQVEEHGPVNYYASPWIEYWKPPESEKGTQRAWLVRAKPGGNDLAARWLADGFVSLAATHLSGVDPGADLPAVRGAVESGYQHVDYAQRRALTIEYHAFLSQMQPDDVIATLLHDRLEIGAVAGDAELDPDATDARLRRDVAWGESEALAVEDLAAPLPSLLDQQGTVVDLTQGLDALLLLISESGPGPVLTPPRPPRPTAPARLRDVPDQASTELHVTREWLQGLVDLLNDRKQVVLYGPPGTGKTYLAQQLVRRLTDRDAVRLVQFHPSYAYEDFFEGFRPIQTAEGGSVGFELRPGPLREIASEARADPGTAYVLIIDEINRANLAKVFGELYFLLEYRNESIRLQYSPDTTFTLPPNLYLIGTMNTADRSIALVDAALRRRFAFVELHPGTEPVNGLLPAWLAANGKDGDERAALLRALNDEIGEEDRDFQIGPAYLMKPDAERHGGLERVWQYSILPLLEEHYYGRLSRDEVHDRFGLASLRARIGGNVDEAGETEGIEAERSPSEGPGSEA